MSDQLRIALENGGQINIFIDVWPNGTCDLHVTEHWEGLTNVAKGLVTAEQLAEAKDPDGMIAAEITRIVDEVHRNPRIRDGWRPRPVVDLTNWMKARNRGDGA